MKTQQEKSSRRGPKVILGMSIISACLVGGFWIHSLWWLWWARSPNYQTGKVTVTTLPEQGRAPLSMALTYTVECELQKGSFRLYFFSYMIPLNESPEALYGSARYFRIDEEVGPKSLSEYGFCMPAYKNFPPSFSWGSDVKRGVRKLTLPLWLPFSFAILAIAVSVRRILSGRNQFLCSTCRYNLFKNISGTCPECGTPIPEVQRNTLIESANQNVGQV